MATTIGQRVVVALEGKKAARNEKGIAPLRWAWRNVVKKDDELLVLNLLNPTAGTSTCICGLGACTASPYEGADYMRFLYQQIGQRREDYRRILRPFHKDCKASGVRFEAKVAAGFRPNAVVLEAANRVKASWIVMDRCLADDESLRLHKENRNVALVDDDEEAEVHHVSPTRTQVHEQPNTGSSEHHSESNPRIPNSHDDRFSMSGKTSNEDPEQAGERSNIVHQNSSMQQNFEIIVGLWLPAELSWEEILATTEGLQAWPFVFGDFEVYKGILADPPGMDVMVKRFAGHTNGVIEAEKKVAMFMSHKNILRAMAYHEGAGGSALVYQYSGEGTLEQYLNHSRGRRAGLTCPERMKAAIEIAQGIHYMHEQCPGAPVIHGDLRPCNVFLGRDCQPLISGFGRTRWLKMERMAEETRYRCWYEVPSDHESVALVKSDVFDFGVLLLRLFCQRPMPQDDSQLVHWAQPLLRQGAFHELIDQDMVELDMYEMYRAMNVATQCTEPRPFLRPSMTEVLSCLRGERSCCVPSSPSSDSSLGQEINPSKKYGPTIILTTHV